MNPGIRAFMYPSYGTGYMPHPFYGAYMGHGYPTFFHHYHPHHLQHQSQVGSPYFAVPLGARYPV